MCFVSTPRVPASPAVPSRNAEDAQRRRANEAIASQQAQGRAATIITTPLGDPSYGQNVNRTAIAGF